MAIPFSERVTAGKHVLAQEIKGEFVLLNLTSERYFGLDETGSSMWRELTTAQSIEASYERLLSTYEVEPEQLRVDLRNFVSRLMKNGLIQISS